MRPRFVSARYRFDVATSDTVEQCSHRALNFVQTLGSALHTLDHTSLPGARIASWNCGNWLHHFFPFFRLLGLGLVGVAAGFGAAAGGAVGFGAAARSGFRGGWSIPSSCSSAS